MAYIRSHTSCQINGGRCDLCGRAVQVGERMGIAYSEAGQCLGWYCWGCEAKLADAASEDTPPEYVD